MSEQFEQLKKAQYLALEELAKSYEYSDRLWKTSIAAMQGLLSDPNVQTSHKEIIAKESVALARALLEVLEHEKGR